MGLLMPTAGRFFFLEDPARCGVDEFATDAALS
ncbi:hypothetical protein J2S62_001179 [Enteractinococcus fodinae]|uniref:Uncharacterized protein n=1 Tax=Enteractinococcus fodinae TaxID=684663 RepID=A0ABU2AZY9_9MICC|nr:hypothetical protein [Enteractinococcus fodinae]